MAENSGVLRDPTNRVSSRAPLVWAGWAAVRFVLLAVAGVVATIVFDDVSPPWWLWALYGAASAAYCVAMPVYRFRVHRWEATETAVYTQRGWLTRERRIAPMSRVQTVDYEQSVFERPFRLATVTVTTASAAGPVKIEGLDRAVAEQLVDDLTRRTEAEAGDAT
ncbi:MAG: Bacterial rane flanked domain protein [Marmoricola sp.]|nr:Bacterial rane flanked domain protein [Marmoricola sp.]